jgi:hypothetical protein
MAWNERRKQFDGQSGAHPSAGVQDLNRDIAFTFKLAQIALHGAATPAKGFHEICDCDFGGAVFAVAGVDAFGQLARATAGTVG